MHGVFEENAGVFPKVFENEDDYFSYLSETAIFTVTRGEVTYYFEPIRAQDLTTRGTVEFRSVCTQPFSATFAPAALHLGLLVNLEALESILKGTSLFEVFDYDYPRIRCLFSKKKISKTDLKLILPLTEALLTCAEDGLKNRGFGEEVYLAPLQERLAALKNRLD